MLTNLLAIFLCGLIGLGLYSYPTSRSGLSPEPQTVGSILLFTCGVLLLQFVHVPFHELGHLVAARLVGFRVFRIVVGVGSPFVTGRIGRTQIALGLPFGGLTVAASNEQAGYRLRRWLFALGGPLATGFVVGSLLLWSPSGASLVVRNVVIVGGLLMLVTTLVPWKRRETLVGFAPASDGWVLLTSPFMSDEQVAEAMREYDVLVGLDAFEQKDFTSALPFLEYLHAENPDDLPPAELLAMTYLLLDRPAEAAPLLHDLVASVDQVADPAGLYNNAAWCELLLDGDRALMDRWSAAAIEAEPESAGVLGTRGSVLIELGELDEGVRLLEQSASEVKEPRDQALTECYLGVAAVKRRDIAEGQRRRERVVALDGGCSLLPRLDAALAAARS